MLAKTWRVCMKSEIPNLFLGTIDCHHLLLKNHQSTIPEFWTRSFHILTACQLRKGAHSGRAVGVHQRHKSEIALPHRPESEHAAKSSWLSTPRVPARSLVCQRLLIAAAVATTARGPLRHPRLALSPYCNPQHALPIAAAGRYVEAEERQGW